MSYHKTSLQIVLVRVRRVFAGREYLQTGDEVHIHGVRQNEVIGYFKFCFFFKFNEKVKLVLQRKKEREHNSILNHRYVSLWRKLILISKIPPRGLQR